MRPPGGQEGLLGAALGLDGQAAGLEGGVQVGFAQGVGSLHQAGAFGGGAGCTVCQLPALQAFASVRDQFLCGQDGLALKAIEGGVAALCLLPGFARGLFAVAAAEGDAQREADDALTALGLGGGAHAEGGVGSAFGLDAAGQQVGAVGGRACGLQLG